MTGGSWQADKDVSSRVKLWDAFRAPDWSSQAGADPSRVRFRGKVQNGHRNVGVTSLQTFCKVMAADETTHGEERARVGALGQPTVQGLGESEKEPKKQSVN